MKKAIQLIETREGCAILERTPRYIVMFRGRRHSKLYFNMTGYTGGYLPAPGSEPGTVVAVNIGERSITAYRRMVAQLNREWAEVDRQAGPPG